MKFYEIDGIKIRPLQKGEMYKITYDPKTGKPAFIEYDKELLLKHNPELLKKLEGSQNNE